MCVFLIMATGGMCIGTLLLQLISKVLFSITMLMSFISFMNIDMNSCSIFNMELCNWICEQIDLHPSFVMTKDYVANVEDMDDFRELIHPKKAYVQCDSDFLPKPYYQVFDQKNNFLPNLSIVDLLFNMGPESLLVLRDSIVKHE